MDTASNRVVFKRPVNRLHSRLRQHWIEYKRMLPNSMLRDIVYCIPCVRASPASLVPFSAVKSKCSWHVIIMASRTTAGHIQTIGNNTKKRYRRISTSKEAMKKLIQIPLEQLSRHVWHLKYKLFTVEDIKWSIHFQYSTCSTSFHCSNAVIVNANVYLTGQAHTQKSNVSHIYYKFPSSGTLIVLWNYILITSFDRLHKKRKKDDKDHISQKWMIKLT